MRTRYAIQLTAGTVLAASFWSVTAANIEAFLVIGLGLDDFTVVPVKGERVD